MSIGLKGLIIVIELFYCVGTGGGVVVVVVTASLNLCPVV